MNSLSLLLLPACHTLTLQAKQAEDKARTRESCLDSVGLASTRLGGRKESSRTSPRHTHRVHTIHTAGVFRSISIYQGRQAGRREKAAVSQSDQQYTATNHPSTMARASTSSTSSTATTRRRSMSASKSSTSFAILALLAATASTVQAQQRDALYGSWSSGTGDVMTGPVGYLQYHPLLCSCIPLHLVQSPSMHNRPSQPARQTRCFFCPPHSLSVGPAVRGGRLQAVMARRMRKKHRGSIAYTGIRAALLYCSLISTHSLCPVYAGRHARCGAPILPRPSTSNSRDGSIISCRESKC